MVAIMVKIVSLIGLCSLAGFQFHGEIGQDLRMGWTAQSRCFLASGMDAQVGATTQVRLDESPSSDRVDDKVATISLEIQFGQSKKKLIKDIPFKKGMTVLDAMKYAKENKKFSFQYRGKNDTAFLTSIDKIKNQGGRGDNWVFRINKKLGKKSFGISRLNSGDKVTWTFGKYKP